MPLFKTPPPSTSTALLEHEDEGGGGEDSSGAGLRRSQRPDSKGSSFLLQHPAKGSKTSKRKIPFQPQSGEVLALP